LNNAKPVAAGEGAKSWFDVPVIPGIHQAVLAATSNPATFNMGDWHKETSCGMAHCRGGWVVYLAGERGRALALASSTLFAAMMIYKYSSPIRVNPRRFFDNNEKSMEDIKRCAVEEAAAK